MNTQGERTLKGVGCRPARLVGARPVAMLGAIMLGLSIVTDDVAAQKLPPVSTAVQQVVTPCSTFPVSMRMTIAADQAWQETNVPIDLVRGVEYLDGAWTTNRRELNGSDPLVDANGYDRAASSGSPLPEDRSGGLVGRGSRGGAFWVGPQYWGIPDAEGTLQLAINERLTGSDLRDNAGAVNVLVGHLAWW